MSETRAIAEVEIDFKEGKRTIQMERKKPFEIDDCKEGKAILLFFKNGEQYNGLFGGIDDDDDIVLNSFSGISSIGIKSQWIDHYFEEMESTIN